jgi:hypothetical protein
MRRGLSLWGVVVLTLATASLVACGGGGEADVASSPVPLAVEPLPPPEIFSWGSQPISASPPPAVWRREREQSGGLRGVRFIKSGGFGEEIRIAEHYALDDRLRCQRLKDLWSDFESLERREFERATQRAALYAVPPIGPEEAYFAERANEQLQRARTEFRAGEQRNARRSIRRAFDEAKRIRYSLNEVLDRVMFDASAYDSFGEVVVQPPQRGEVAGEPSVSVDFTLDSIERRILYRGRQVYVLKNSRLFVLTFLGLGQNLPLFDEIVATVSFPPNSCVL